VDEAFADERMMRVEQLAPPTVAKLDGLARGVDDVREQHRGEHAIRLGSRAEPPSETLRSRRGSLSELPENGT
jgi:hypothetical protein